MKNQLSRKTMRALVLLGSFVISFSATQLRAETLDSLEVLSDSRLETLVEAIGASTHYKAVAPGEPLGTLGFDLGIGISNSKIDDALFDDASNGDFGTGALNVIRLQASKGLPFGWDVGASYSNVMETDMSSYGLELRYALIEGGVVMPALAVRGSYSQLRGDDNLDLNNLGLELTISKGFLMFTPYGGVGVIRTEADARGAGVKRSVEVNQEKLYVGVVVNLGIAFTAEIDRTGEYESFTLRTGFRF